MTAMPPEASSRSSTYLPKIWGNTLARHRTAVLVCWLCSACTTTPGPEEKRTIRAHWLPLCAPEGPPSATQLDLEALGDYDPTPETHEVLKESDGRRKLVAPPTLRAAEIRATDGRESFLGVGEGAAGDLDVALFPESDACPLLADDGKYPGLLGGETIGATRDGRFVLVAGGRDSGRVATGARLVDATTGLE